MKRIIPALLAIVLFASCNQYKKTPSGLKYKIEKGGSKETLKHGQYVKLNMEYRITPKDSVLGVSSFGHVPMYIMMDTTRKETYSFMEIITQLSPGDKLEFLMSVDSLKNQGKIQAYDNVFHARDVIKGKVEILKSFATSAEAQADYDKEMAAEKDREIKVLEDYAAKKGLKIQKTASGAMVAVENPGGPLKGDTGTRVSSMYKGYFPDGKEFDSNINNPRNPTNQPMVVDIGAHGVVPGLEEAFKFFGKGGKGKVLIPSMLAYGPSGNPPVIPAYANLIFDIEVIDVVAAPAPQAGPGAPLQK